jgi:RsiW-degrading membrane proteinase PrsW (M82 family)
MSANYPFILLSFIIGIFAVNYLRTYDIHEKEPVFKMVLVTLWGGIFSIGLSTVLYVSLHRIGIQGHQNVFGAIFVIGPVEEAAKFIALLTCYFFIRHEINEPTDGLIYMSCVALGFSLIENYFYAINSQRSGFVFFLRLLTSTPGHILFSVFMGIAFYSIVRLKTGAMLLFVSFVYACLAHGLYNSIVFHGLGLILLILLLFQSYQWSLALLSYTTARSPFRKSLKEFVAEYEQPVPVGGHRCPGCGDKNRKISYTKGRIHIQKCGNCQRFLATGESLGAVYKYFGSVFQNKANPYLAKKIRISSFFRRAKSKAAKDRKDIVSFSLDELNATLIQKNREIVENLDSKWWFPIKFDFKPKISQDYVKGVAGRQQNAHQKFTGWFQTNKVLWVPLLITFVAVLVVLVKLGTAENILSFLFLGFPFVIIFFGVIYAVGLMIKDT